MAVQDQWRDRCTGEGTGAGQPPDQRKPPKGEAGGPAATAAAAAGRGRRPWLCGGPPIWRPPLLIGFGLLRICIAILHVACRCLPLSSFLLSCSRGLARRVLSSEELLLGVWGMALPRWRGPRQPVSWEWRAISVASCALQLESQLGSTECGVHCDIWWLCGGSAQSERMWEEECGFCR